MSDPAVNVAKAARYAGMAQDSISMARNQTPDYRIVFTTEATVYAGLANYYLALAVNADALDMLVTQKRQDADTGRKAAELYDDLHNNPIEKGEGE